MHEGKAAALIAPDRRQRAQPSKVLAINRIAPIILSAVGEHIGGDRLIAAVLGPMINTDRVSIGVSVQ
jgi:hypothetical protein